jgi:hypothetical protein
MALLLLLQVLKFVALQPMLCLVLLLLLLLISRPGTGLAVWGGW